MNTFIRIPVYILYCTRKHVLTFLCVFIVLCFLVHNVFRGLPRVSSQEIEVQYDDGSGFKPVPPAHAHVYLRLDKSVQVHI